MRLWSLHPRYLDAKGIVALWREALLAQKVLKGGTRGYTRHPQLIRFSRARDPQGAIALYLRGVWEEASRRGYAFDKKKIPKTARPVKMRVTRGQMRYEFQWLGKKLMKRDPARHARFKSRKRLEAHPLFRVKAGPVEPWERVK